jgi:hypothetical protein
MGGEHMTEQEFIYGRLHYLTEQVESLTNAVEKHTDLIGKLLGIIEQMQSPEYIKRQVKVAEMAEVAEKIKYFKSIINK